MPSYISPKAARQESGIAGNGLFAVANIQKGEIVVDYTGGLGKYVGFGEAERLWNQGIDYGMQVDDDLFFIGEGTEVEDVDYINHSCDPNCGINGRLQVVAMREIARGEEIAFDYAMSESCSLRMECRCGSAGCRKVITGNDWKLPALQKRYSGFFSDYLQKKIKTPRD